MEHTMDHTGGMVHDMAHNMKSWFHISIDDIILFDFWQVNNLVQLLISMLLVAVLAFLGEFARFQLWLMERRTSEKSVRGYSTFGIVAREPPRSIWSFGMAYALQLTLGYMTMQIFMTYSIWLGLALCLGGTAGFCYFEQKRHILKNLPLLK